MRRTRLGQHGKGGDVEALAIGRTLRAARERRGLTQREVTSRAALGSHGYLRKLERGEILPSLVTLRRLADALETPAWNLLRCAERRLEGEA